jgi:hypothetical protein
MDHRPAAWCHNVINPADLTAETISGLNAEQLVNRG